MEKKYLSIKEFAETLGLTYLTCYRYVKEKKVPSVRIGRKTLIPMSYLDTLEKKAQ